jgi:hypothetical protein
MLNTLDANQNIGQLLNSLGFAFNYQDFEASVMVQMHMGRGHDAFMMRMLHICQFLWQKTVVMIVNKSDGPDHRRTRIFYNGSHQAVAD